MTMAQALGKIRLAMASLLAAVGAVACSYDWNVPEDGAAEIAPPSVGNVVAASGSDAGPPGVGSDASGLPASQKQTCGELASGGVLKSGGALESCNHAFSLEMQNDGNLVLYANA